jgi:hypothetical protein
MDRCSENPSRGSLQCPCACRARLLRAHRLPTVRLPALVGPTRDHHHHHHHHRPPQGSCARVQLPSLGLAAVSIARVGGCRRRRRRRSRRRRSRRATPPTPPTPRQPRPPSPPPRRWSSPRSRSVARDGVRVARVGRRSIARVGGRRRRRRRRSRRRRSRRATPPTPPTPRQPRPPSPSPPRWSSPRSRRHR